MPLFDFICENCNNELEVLFTSNEEIVDKIKCSCGEYMYRKPPTTSFLPKTSNTNNAIHKGQNVVGTGNLEPHQLPKNTGPRIWKTNKKRK